MELKTVIVKTKNEICHCTNVVAITTKYDDGVLESLTVTFSTGITHDFNDVLSYEVLIPDKDVPVDEDLYLLG